jgi:hypothetical protein
MDESIWMGLFSCIIFVEKMWSRGLLVARIAGISLMVLGIVAIMFAPNAHNLLRIGDDDEANINYQLMDMKGMMDMKKGSINGHKQYNDTSNKY